MTITDGLQNLERRSSDGTGNNLLDPELGSAGTNFARLGDPAYADGVGTVEDHGNARAISNSIVSQDGEIANTHSASDLLTYFGQFIDHDIDLTPTGTTEQLTIDIPAGDTAFTPGSQLSLDRSTFAAGTGENGVPREQVNIITSFVDASNVYGSSEDITKLLRADTGNSAYLLTSDNGYAPTMGQLRAVYPTLDADHPELIAGVPTDDAYVGGDIRINENVALTSMHTAWIGEHNHQVDKLKGEHPDWSQDQLFDAARIVVEAQYQNVVFNEYLPFLLGEENIPDYAGYNSNIDPSISTEFATAAFRLGHSQLSSVMHRTNEDGSTVADGDLGLFDAFFSPSELDNGGGVDALMRGLAGGAGQEIDQNIVDDVRNLLFANSGQGTDLASLNIVRGRDHGIPTLNDMRVELGLDPYADFSDLTQNAALQAQFAAVYTSIDEVDLWVGGLAEEKVPGSQLGSTFHSIVLDQFMRLRDGDRLYFEDRLKDFPELLQEIKETSLSDVLLRNTGIDYLQDDVFVVHNRIGGTQDDDYLEGTNEHDLIIGFGGHDNLVGLKGDDDLYGGAGHDYLRGFEGNDVLVGEAGNDALDGGSGNDKLSGGEGYDWLYGGKDDDLLDGGADHDKLLGGSGNDKLFGDSKGTIGGSTVTTFDVLEGDSGNDILVGDAAKLEGNAKASNDYLDGGRGDDILYGDAIELAGNANGGDDNLQGGSGNDTLYGDSETAEATTTGGHDFLVAGSGNDTLVGGGGNDALHGDSGNDILIGDTAKLEGDSQGGEDYLEGGRDDDVIYGDTIELAGNAAGGDDNLQGGSGNDILYGDSLTAEATTTGGDDYLVGGSGNDKLIGGGGNDFMEGGRGNDVFVFASDSGEDIVWDFSQVGGNDDTLDVSGYGFTAITDFSVFDVFEGSVVEFSSTDHVMLVGVDAATLTDEDFLFA